MQTVDPREVGMDPRRIECFFAVIEKKITKKYLSLLAWADPLRELVFVGLTSGLIEESRSIARWHVWSDLAQACVVD
jgi:hypothetical protein